VRAAILNRFTRLGTPKTVAMPKSVQGLGHYALSRFMQQRPS